MKRKAKTTQRIPARFVRITDQDWETLKRAAAAEGVGASEFLRVAGLREAARVLGLKVGKAHTPGRYPRPEEARWGAKE